MRPHRYVVNLGYTLDEAGDESRVGMLFVSTFMELCFEMVVDVIALSIEAGHGKPEIDHNACLGGNASFLIN